MWGLTLASPAGPVLPEGLICTGMWLCLCRLLRRSAVSCSSCRIWKGTEKTPSSGDWGEVGIWC